jgi:alpha-L-rhamnosidase
MEQGHRLAHGFAFVSGRGGLAPGAVSQAEVRDAVALENLRCEYRENPLGIDTLQPRLSWIITANDAAGRSAPARGVRQTAYHVLVASALDLLAKDQGDLWNSGKVANRSEYPGGIRRSATCYMPVELLESPGLGSECGIS